MQIRMAACIATAAMWAGQAWASTFPTPTSFTAVDVAEGQVDLTLVIGIGGWIPLPERCTDCRGLPFQFLSGTVTIADGQGNSQSFSPYPLNPNIGAEYRDFDIFVFHALYHEGSYLATFTASILEVGLVMFPCGSGPGLMPGCPPGTTYNKTVDFAGSVPVTVAPIPGSLPLFASGLLSLGLMTWRRRRRGVTRPYMYHI